MKNVLILFGGRSVEHDISIITGLGALNNIAAIYNPIPVYIDKKGQWWTGEKLKQIKSFQPFDNKKLFKCALNPGSSNMVVYKRFGVKDVPVYCAINCLHGHDGEDGAVAGALQLANIPNTSANVLSDALCMDKTLTKQILSYHKIKTVEYVAFNKTEFKNKKQDLLAQIGEKLGYPCIIKPNALGSSIGVSITKNEWECEKSIETALSFGDEVLVEKYIGNNKELNVAIMQDKEELMVSNIEEVCLNNGLYNFNEKYKDKSIKRIVPANIDSTLQKSIVKTATSAYKILKCDGVVRFDFLYDVQNKKVYLNEVNTIPGSLACYLWKEPQMAYNILLDKLVQNAIYNHANQNDKKLNFESDVLNNLTQDSFKMVK